jgi:hypothetical protein
MSMRALLHNNRIPVKVRNAFAQAIVSTSSEQVLWREVAARHTLDAFGVVGQDEREAVAEARTWFRDCYDDVHLLFEYAGVNPDPVVRELEVFLKEQSK